MKIDMMWGVLDQGLQSLINLSIGVLLIYYESKYSYGLYGLAFATLLLFVGVSNALVSTQMTVIAPSKIRKERMIFCGSLIGGFFIILFSVEILLILLYEAIKNIFDLSAYRFFVYAMAIAVPALIFQEIMRRYFYLKLIPKKVFIMDICYAVILCIGLYYIIYLELNDKHIYTIALIGISASVSSLIYFMGSDLKIKGSIRYSYDSFREAWVGGKWALGGVMVTWGQSQGYVYVLGLLKGSELIAEANAARLFLAPISVVSTSIYKVIMPRLVNLKNNHNIDYAVSIVRRIMFVMLILIVMYTSILGIYADWIVYKFMGNKYQMVNMLIYLWAFYFICQAFRNTNSILLQVIRLFKRITLSNLFTSVFVLVTSLLTVTRYEVQGVIMVMSLGELMLAIIFWKILRNERHKY